MLVAAGTMSWASSARAMNKYLLILWIVAMTGCLRTTDSAAATVEVYYVPIGVETVVAMTAQNIDRHCQVCGKMEISADRIQEINNIIRDAPGGDFNEYRVRLKMIYVGGTVLVIDNDGGVKSSASNIHKKISPQKLDVLGRLIEDY